MASFARLNAQKERGGGCDEPPPPQQLGQFSAGDSNSYPQAGHFIRIALPFLSPAHATTIDKTSIPTSENMINLFIDYFLSPFKRIGFGQLRMLCLFTYLLDT
jgi:hypothetical protein